MVEPADLICLPLKEAVVVVEEGDSEVVEGDSIEVVEVALVVGVEALIEVVEGDSVVEEVDLVVVEGDLIEVEEVALIEAAEEVAEEAAEEASEETPLVIILQKQQIKDL